MLLTGHGGPVLSTKFSPDGNHVLSGGHDKLMLLWETFGECANILNFKGHANAILEVSWSGDGESAFSASADKTAALWDAKTGGRVRQFKGHTQVVNSFNPSRDANTCASASDDGTCRVWDARVRLCQHTISHPWAVTAACVSHDGMHVYTGCLDGVVRSYDLRNPQITHLELEGHQDIVTGIKLAPDGNSLLSNAMDNVIRCWDVKPYASDDRCTKGTTRTRKQCTHARTRRGACCSHTPAPFSPLSYLQSSSARSTITRRISSNARGRRAAHRSPPALQTALSMYGTRIRSASPTSCQGMPDR